MLPVSKQHLEALRDLDSEEALLIEVMNTLQGDFYLSLSDYTITIGDKTYVSTHNVQLNQVTPNTGLGTVKVRLTVDPSRKNWFEDEDHNLRVNRVRLRVLVAPFHKASNQYLEPFIPFTGAGRDPAVSDEGATVDFEDIFGLQPAELVWLLSKEHQRRADSTDTSLDNINKRPPQRGTNLF